MAEMDLRRGARRDGAVRALARARCLLSARGHWSAGGWEVGGTSPEAGTQGQDAAPSLFSWPPHRPLARSVMRGMRGGVGVSRPPSLARECRVCGMQTFAGRGLCVNVACDRALAAELGGPAVWAQGSGGREAGACRGRAEEWVGRRGREVEARQQDARPDIQVVPQRRDCSGGLHGGQGPGQGQLAGGEP